ncbi:unnamed protein product [Orchesella dallaii]|uniref:RZ-type domain-containing protein n=1 Tax=Orchesella dallaii TaxID=48710 RepID=A0ABP1S6A0_9HEXA
MEGVGSEDEPEAEMMKASPWSKFENKPPISGFTKNCILVLHDEKLLGDEDTEELSILRIDPVTVDREQVKMAIETCKYLSNNGVKKYNLLSNCKESLWNIEEELEQDETEPVLPVNLEASNENLSTAELDLVDVTVVLLLCAYGPENEKKKLNLLHLAIASSRNGVIILGNIPMDIRIMNKEFASFLEDMRIRFAPTNYLPICCRRHDLVHLRIFNAFDLRVASPLGGCKKFCDVLKCGHICPYPCHQFDLEHVSEKYRCQQYCERIPPCGHKCLKLCWEECKCDVAVAVDFPCGHYKRIIVPCYMKSEIKCDVSVKRKLPCDHLAVMMCSESPDTYQCKMEITTMFVCGRSVSYKCFENLETLTCNLNHTMKLACGHSVDVLCKDYTADYKKKAVCKQKCMQLLECGHICEAECHPKDPFHEVIKCMKLCTRKCPRVVHKCDKKHACNEPCEPCNGAYEYRLVCGHAVTIICSEPDVDENNYYCEQKCMRIHPFCRHPCTKVCGEECGDCEASIKKVVTGCTRGHMIVKKCTSKSSSKQCNCLVFPASPSACGHKVKVPCHEADRLTPNQISEYCDVPCDTAFFGDGECGHGCRGSCKKCYQGRFHMRCQEACDKILICGHLCPSPCSLICYPCPFDCYNSCEHRNCPYECGAPCELTCEEPCTYRCEHSACTKKCSEVCDKELCYEPCQVMLKCGHPCIGFCGEICPPFCKVCDPEKIQDDPFCQKTEVDPNSRFLYLPNCGHCLDSVSLDKWLTVGSSDEIQPTRCPLCPTRITNFRRYSAILYENRKLIDTIRSKFFGEAKEIEVSLQKTTDIVTSFQKEFGGTLHYPEYAGYILTEVESEVYALRKDQDDTECASLFLHKAKFLEWIANEWITANREISQFYDSVEPKYLSQLCNYWMDILGIVSRRSWPLHPNEMIAYKKEQQRFHDMISLCKRFDKAIPNQLIYTKEGRKWFREAQNILFTLCTYDDSCRNRFLQKLGDLDGTLSFTIQLTHEERQQVVTAFGTKLGRWFKCKNGHPYVITECGGAMELSTCSECGVLIGGDKHALAEGNYLATEMDGAQEPMWETTLERGE